MLSCLGIMNSFLINCFLKLFTGVQNRPALGEEDAGENAEEKEDPRGGEQVDSNS